ncbi:transposase [Marinobacter salexigens]|uniref:Transposase n=1 Tax=Marinobacter salexigens TaxID=1925763 RepID=A0ABS6A4F8_9GAMM|nr:transposase [Marinobacter salexigens]
MAECQKPGASVSRIALDNGLSANMLRRWINEARRAGNGSSTAPVCVPVRVPAATPPVVEKHRAIRIEIPRAGGPIVVEWPAEQSDQCAAFLRELLPRSTLTKSGWPQNLWICMLGQTRRSGQPD